MPSLSHTYRRPVKMIYTLLTGGHMNRAHRHGRTSLKAKPALALFLSMLIAATMMAPGLGPTPAMAAPAATLPGRPLAELLNPDGTLNLGTGFNGTLDLAGWQLEGGLGGPPRFVPAAPGDENWDARFTPPGMTDIVNAL